MLRPGDTIGGYILKRQLGRGAFGVVWLAEKVTPIATTEFALKFALDETPDLEAIKAEAKLWKEASGHPNVLPIIEADIYEGFVVIVSAYAPDGSLDAYLKANQEVDAPIASAIDMVSGILAGLEHLHSRRIIHRDLKPPNILLQGKMPLLADFGIARLLSTNVHTTTVAGTPYYMAPEAFSGERSVQTDIWSVGVILYQLLTRRLPFAGNDVAALIQAVKTDPPEAMPSSIPQVIQGVVTCALSKSPASRYQSAAEMRQALHAALFSLSNEHTVRYPSEPVPPSPTDPNVSQSTAPPNINSTNWQQRFVPTLLALLLLVGGVTIATRFSSISGKLGFVNQSYPLEQADLKTWELKQTLTGHTEAVRSVFFSTDGQVLVSADYDAVILWDAKTGAMKRQLPKSKKNAVAGIALSSDGKILAVCDSENDPIPNDFDLNLEIKLWNMQTGTVQKTFIVSRRGISSMAFSPDDKLIAVAIDLGSHDMLNPYHLDGAVTLWDATTGENIRTLSKNDAYVNSVAFSPDGKTLLSSDRYKMVRGWDVQTGALLWEVEATSAIGAVAFSPDGKTFAGVAQEGSVNIWDAATRDLKRTLKDGDFHPEAIAYSPGGRILVAVGDKGGFGSKGVMKLWDIQTGELKRTLETPSTIRTVALSSDGSTIATGGDDKTVRMWRAAASK